MTAEEQSHESKHQQEKHCHVSDSFLPCQPVTNGSNIGEAQASFTIVTTSDHRGHTLRKLIQKSRSSRPFVAEQLGLDVAHFAAYAERDQTRREHVLEIRAAGFGAFFRIDTRTVCYAREGFLNIVLDGLCIQ